MQRSVKM